MFDAFFQCLETFQQCGVEDPLLETLRLLDLASNGALRDPDLSILDEHHLGVQDVAQMRKRGYPLEYILGCACFNGLLLECTHDTLIPRQETELLVSTALALIQQMQETQTHLTVLDVGTGCGNIALSLAANSQNTTVFATDVSEEAIRIARSNVERLHLEERVTLFCGDLLAPFYEQGYAGAIDLIVSNPPYLPTTSLRRLAPEIVDHEPKVALDAGAYGLDIIRRLIKDAVMVLRDGGILVFEIGAGQDRMVTWFLERSMAYEQIRCFDDGAEIRVVSAVKRPAGSPRRAGVAPKGR